MLRLWDALDRHCRVWTKDGKYFDRKRGPLATPISALNNGLDRLLWSRLFRAGRPRLSESLQNELAAHYQADAKCLAHWLDRRLTGWDDLTGLTPTKSTIS